MTTKEKPTVFEVVREVIIDMVPAEITVGAFTVSRNFTSGELTRRILAALKEHGYLNPETELKEFRDYKEPS